MNKKKMKGIGSLVGKAVAIIGTAGAASLLSDIFLFGGKLTANSDDDDETEEKTQTEETKEDSEETHFCEEDIEIEDGKEDEEG